MSKILTITATGLVGLVLGAGVAGAGQDVTRVDRMQPALTERCEELHSAMGEHMGDTEHTTSMMGSMGAGMSGTHHDHHSQTEG